MAKKPQAATAADTQAVATSGAPQGAATNEAASAATAAGEHAGPTDAGTPQPETKTMPPQALVIEEVPWALDPETFEALWAATATSDARTLDFGRLVAVEAGKRAIACTSAEASALAGAAEDDEVEVEVCLGRNLHHDGKPYGEGASLTMRRHDAERLGRAGHVAIKQPTTED
ncbi:hypothetical protein CLD22_24740 [Rubrivivax gelatinosus]|nr:hypothetical protein [Rubrivivax gelatinosus]